MEWLAEDRGGRLDWRESSVKEQAMKLQPRGSSMADFTWVSVLRACDVCSGIVVVES